VLGPRKKALIGQYGPNPTLDQQLDSCTARSRVVIVVARPSSRKRTPVAVANAYVTKFMRQQQGAETTGDISRAMKALGVKRAAGGRTKFADGGADPIDLLPAAYDDTVDPAAVAKKKAMEAAMSAAAPRAIIDGPAPDAAPAAADPTAFTKPSPDVPAGLAAASAPTDSCRLRSVLPRLSHNSSRPTPRRSRPTPASSRYRARRCTVDHPLLSGIGALATTPTNNPFNCSRCRPRGWRAGGAGAA